MAVRRGPKEEGACIEDVQVLIENVYVLVYILIEDLYVQECGMYMHGTSPQAQGHGGTYVHSLNKDIYNLEEGRVFGFKDKKILLIE